jgi:hypothetical protein
MKVFHWMCGVSSTKTIKILKRLGLVTGARWHDSLVLLFLTDAVLVYGGLPRLTKSNAFRSGRWRPNRHSKVRLITSAFSL